MLNNFGIDGLERLHLHGAIIRGAGGGGTKTSLPGGGESPLASFVDS